MIELFNYVKTNTSKTLKVKANRISYWRSDTINNFISCLESNKDRYSINKYEVSYGQVLNDTYVMSFDIEIKTSDEFFKYLQNNFIRVLSIYNKDNVIIYNKPYLKTVGDINANI